MAKPINITQSSSKTIQIRQDSSSTLDFTAADEIEILIDSDPQIKKTLTGGGVTSVLANSFTVVLSDSDTQVRSGEFGWEGRYTVGTTKTPGRLNPSKVRIIDSAFDSVP